MSRILVVEDSPTMLAKIVKLLEDQGYEVLPARDGDEAFQLAISDKPDVIVLDVILPRLNGYQVCRQLKSSSETSEIPVIMLTSKTRNQAHQWGDEQGADDYVMKPIDEADLLAVIRRYLSEVEN